MRQSVVSLPLTTAVIASIASTASAQTSTRKPNVGPQSVQLGPRRSSW